MNLAAFEAFLKVMETGSISIAAEQLFITQPAVTKRIHTLEEYFGVKLFESAGRGIQPTHAAHSLLPKVRTWLNELGEIHHTLSHEQNQVQGRLKIGTSHHIGLHHLADPLKAFVQSFPQVTLDVHFVDSEQAHEQVLAGELELAFLTLPPIGDERLSYLTIWNDPLVFVASPFHPLAQQSQLKLEDLIAYPYGEYDKPVEYSYTDEGQQIETTDWQKYQMEQDRINNYYNQARFEMQYSDWLDRNKRSYYNPYNEFIPEDVGFEGVYQQYPVKSVGLETDLKCLS